MKKKLLSISAFFILCFSTNAQTILGVDVSSYQGTVNWTKVKTAGYGFAFAKATESTNITDGDFVANITNGQAAGMVMGAYHFASPESDSASQEASYFLGVAGPYIKACGLPPVLDLEDPPSGPALNTYFDSTQLSVWVKEWFTAVKTATGITPILYTDGNEANYLKRYLTTYGLWVAEPGVPPTTTPTVTYLGRWYPNWDFMQYSWTATVSGIGDEVDLDVFHGDSAQFKTLIGCAAVDVSFSANPTTICQGASTTFTDASTSTGTIIAWKWTFSGGNPSTSTLQNPVVTYTVGGSYNVKEVVTSSTGKDSITETDYIRVIPPSTLPLVETFTASVFPPTGWTMNYPNANDSAWQRCTTNGYSSSNCMFFPANCGTEANISGQRQQIYTPAYTFPCTSNGKMTFEVAYEPYNSTYSDTLAIYYSLDCGNTWTNIYLKGGSALGTTGFTVADNTDTGKVLGENGCFIPPNTAAWRKDSIEMPELSGDPSVIFSFEDRSGYGNIIYIDDINITATTQIAITMKSQTNVLCNGSSTGTATANAATGGTTPYTYSWTSSGGTNLTASDLSAGTYTITVIDKEGCSATTSVAITQPSKVAANAVVNANTTACSNIGSVTASASGGTSPYTYSWTGGSTNANATGLSAGSYTVTVKDNNDCSGTATIAITAPASGVAANAIVNTNAIACANIGSATASASGGTSPYTYSWTGGSTSANATGLSAGSYTVTVKDNNGCSGIAVITITAPASIAANAIVNTNASECANSGSATASASGGTSPYTYSWTGGSTNTNATGLSAGSYTVTIKDNNDCSVAESITITAPAALNANLTGPSTLCDGATAMLNVTLTGGANPYTYSWSSGINSTNSTASVSPSSTQTYTVIITDANGCQKNAQITIVVGPPLVVSPVGSTSVCAGEATTLCANTSGGSGGNTYLWQPGNITTPCVTLTPTLTTTYTVSVTDNCPETTTVTTTVQVNSVDVSFSADTTEGCAPLCVQFYNTTTISGGGSAESYLWNFGSGDSSSVKDPMYCYSTTGTYNVSLTVVSDSGCSATLKMLNYISTICTGIDPIGNGTDDLTIYPNPNKGIFTIQSTFVSEHLSVEIYNVLGEKLYSNPLTINNSPLTINISNQSNGVYLYRVITDSGNLIGEGKLIIQK
jgi:GH25 family lysozyme M1 (1,4-beta-N-acetylmuramidase)